MDQLVECVPNFSDGRNKEVIDAIANAISKTPGCFLLDVDPGKSTNRTVYTFVASPADVIRGALAAARVGHQMINMANQKGEHPRVGAMDVCPFIPVKNISIQECVEISIKFAKLLSEELNVSVYLYGESQPLAYRKELSQIRQGEYEGLKAKLETDPKMRPDFGPAIFNPSYGASCVGARNYLIAYNINLLSTKEQAHRIALNVREQGRSEKEPGRLKSVKAIGWYLEEENMAQISMNLVDYQVTNIETAFEECVKDAQELKIGVCGSQLVGLVPLDSILKAAEFYIKRDGLLVLEESQKVRLVVERLGLNSISHFNPQERIIDYLIEKRLAETGTVNEAKRYQNGSVRSFVDAIAARTAIPGGGCVSALVASLGSGLTCMSSLLTYGNRKFEKHDAQIRAVLPKIHATYTELVDYIDKDAMAFNSFMAARKLADKTEAEKQLKKKQLDDAIFECINVPFTVAYKSSQIWSYLQQLAPVFNIETRSDFLVGIKCLETGIYGAYMNVLTNLNGIDESNYHISKIKEISVEAEKIWKTCQEQSNNLTTLVQARTN